MKKKLAVLCISGVLVLCAAAPAAAFAPLATEAPTGEAGGGEDDGGFPWGILGLAGLAGLAGLRRRDDDGDRTRDDDDATPTTR